MFIVTEYAALSKEQNKYAITEIIVFEALRTHQMKSLNEVCGCAGG